MSIIRIIENLVRSLIKFNQLELNNYFINPKIVLDTPNMKREQVFELEFYFKKSNILLDNLLVLYNAFIIRFKVYRCYINFDNKLFKFTIKKRNLQIAKDIIED